MHPAHHPTETSRHGYLTSELGAGAALLVGLHLSRCPICAADQRVRSGAPSRRTAAVERSFAPAAPKAELATAPFDLDNVGGFKRGRWWWIAPGVSIATLKGAAGVGERIYLLRGRARARLPRHTHPGSEWTMVMAGAYLDGGERFGVADVSEFHESHTHQLIVTPEADCVCLVVTDLPLRVYGLGRLLRPFLKL